MRIGGILRSGLVWGLAAAAASADVVSHTGVLATPDAVADFQFYLPAAGPVVLQTYGFGGGTNAAGTPIAPGGTDPFLAIFSGTGPTATIVTDAVLNPFGTSLIMTNYAGFEGCPPAGAPSIGGAAVCGDIRMSLTLAAGAYTAVLTDGQYVPFAVFDNGMLGEGFVDFTGGVFCNAEINGEACPNTSGAYALDITTPSGVPPVPEPSTLSLLCGVALAIAAMRQRRRRAGRRQRQPW